MERLKVLVSETVRDKEDLISLYSPDHAARVLPHLEIGPEFTIADIGCGTGAFELALLSKKAAFKKLYAVDVCDIALEFVDFTVKEAQLDPAGKVEYVLSKLDDVKLPAASVDLALLINTPIFFTVKGEVKPELADKPTLKKDFRCVVSIYKALKPGGLLHEFLYIPGLPPALSEPWVYRVSGLYKLAGFEPLHFEVVKFSGKTHYHGVYSKRQNAPSETSQ